MRKNELDELLEQLDWDQDQAAQDEAVRRLVAASDGLDLSVVMQNGDKSRWQNEARVILAVGYPRFRSVIPSMVEWLKDANWPGFSEVVQSLAKIPKAELASHLSEATRRSLVESDVEWCMGLRRLVQVAGLQAEQFADGRVRAALFEPKVD